jgi:hypothetical protein
MSNIKDKGELIFVQIKAYNTINFFLTQYGSQLASCGWPVQLVKKSQLFLSMLYSNNIVNIF